MPLPSVQFIENRGNILLREQLLRSTYAPSGDATSALIRSSTSIASPLPVAGGAFPITSRTHASDELSDRVSRALRTMRIAAEQADAGRLIVTHGTPTMVLWARDEAAPRLNKAPLTEAPQAVRDAVTAAQAARTAITGGFWRPMDRSFS